MSGCRPRRPRNSGSWCSAPLAGYPVAGERHRPLAFEFGRDARARATPAQAPCRHRCAVDRNVSGTRRTISSLSVWTLSGRMFCCWRTAMRCPDDGLIGWSLRRISPSTTLFETDAVASARRKSRSKPRTFSPSRPRQWESRTARSMSGSPRRSRPPWLRLPGSQPGRGRSRRSRSASANP